MTSQEPNSPQSSDDASSNPQNSTSQSQTPLSSPEEPTRAYPSDASHTYSSDPSEYAFLPEESVSEIPSKEPSSETNSSTDTTREDKASPETEHLAEKEKLDSDKKKRQTINLSNLKGDLNNYMTTNREQLFIYILLALGLILTLFTSSLLGTLIIGLVAGYYFASQIIYFVRNLGQMVGGQDQLHYVVLAAIALALFIEAPGIFIGAIIVATFKQVLTTPQGEK